MNTSSPSLKDALASIEKQFVSHTPTSGVVELRKPLMAKQDEFDRQRAELLARAQQTAAFTHIVLDESNDDLISDYGSHWTKIASNVWRVPREFSLGKSMAQLQRGAWISIFGDRELTEEVDSSQFANPGEGLSSLHALGDSLVVAAWHDNYSWLVFAR